MTQNHFIQKTLMLIAFVAMTMIGGFARPAVAAEKPAAKKPAHRVVACYFHRTQRCPTCKKISAQTEEAVKKGFVKELKSGLVALHLIDFQDAKNKKYADFYKISNPTLIIMDIHDGKVKSWKPLPKVWSLVGKKDQFLAYVQNEIRACAEAK